MKDLFMSLLLNLQTLGNIVAANLYKDGKYASLEVECPDGKFTINIYKEDQQNED